MSHVYFQRSKSGYVSPNGPVFIDIQTCLNASGVSALVVDGLYGNQTEKALRVFQAEQNLAITGNVTEETWGLLTHSAQPSLFKRCLQVIAAFEGTGFTHVVGNFDGAGITWGIIGFTLINNELGNILTLVNKEHPGILASVFSGDTQEILEITGPGTSKVQKIAWANSISSGKSNYSVVEPWRTYFHDLGRYPEVQKIQTDRARNEYWNRAKALANSFDLTEDLDYLLFFDIAVQNGSVKNQPQLLAEFAEIPNISAQDKRSEIVKAVVKGSNPKWQEDVNSRKSSIVAGKGTIHGGKYDFADWGLANARSSTALD